MSSVAVPHNTEPYKTKANAVATNLATLEKIKNNLGPSDFLCQSDILLKVVNLKIQTLLQNYDVLYKGFRII